MIEVEKKVHIREIDLKTIEREATFLSTTVLTDTYYDTANFRYTTNDIWLRERECRFELKIGSRGIDGNIDVYEEITEENLILKKLGLEKEKELSKALIKAKIFPYATFQTVRRKYQIDDFIIDLDLAYFDDFIYRIAEIELVVNADSKVPAAKKAIQELIQKLGMDSQLPVKAKLIEYLSQKNPTHYQALVASGVISQR